MIKCGIPHCWGGVQSLETWEATRRPGRPPATHASPWCAPHARHSAASKLLPGPHAGQQRCSLCTCLVPRAASMCKPDPCRHVYLNSGDASTAVHELSLCMGLGRDTGAPALCSHTRKLHMVDGRVRAPERTWRRLGCACTRAHTRVRLRTSFARKSQAAAAYTRESTGTARQCVPTFLIARLADGLPVAAGLDHH